MFDNLIQIFTAEGISSLLSLTALEIILGIDNVVVIALIIQHLKKPKREKARKTGLTLALGLRILLLLSIAWVLSLTKPFFHALGRDFSGKDMLLVVGGIFLIYKAVTAIHEMFTDEDEQELRDSKGSMFYTIAQIMFIDLIFSFDSVITAVGLTTNIPIIIVAMTIAMLIMLFFTGFVSEFIQKYPTIKTLALSFILLIGVLIVGEGFGAHVARSYVYFAMAFSGIVEAINILIKKKKDR
jgi:predicted tellurium resistance membrane protein TerC